MKNKGPGPRTQPQTPSLRGKGPNRSILVSHSPFPSGKGVRGLGFDMKGVRPSRRSALRELRGLGFNTKWPVFWLFIFFLLPGYAFSDEKSAALLPVDYLDAQEARFDPGIAAQFDEAALRGAAKASCSMMERDILEARAKIRGVDLDKCRDHACMNTLIEYFGIDVVLKVDVEQEGALYTFRVFLDPGGIEEKKAFSGTRDAAIGHMESIVQEALADACSESEPEPEPDPVEEAPVEDEPEAVPEDEDDNSVLYQALGYSLLGVGAGVLATGAVFVAFDGECRYSGCEDNTTDPEIEKWDSAMQGWIMAGAGAAAIGTGLYFIISDAVENESGTEVSAGPLNGGFGMTVKGRF